VCVLDMADGSVVYNRTEDKPSNHWTVGQEAVQTLLHSLLREALKEIGADSFVTVGFSLSGMDNKSEQTTFIEGFSALTPTLADNIRVFNDTVGSAFTASPEGGAILIAGTGSIGRVMCRVPSTETEGEGEGETLLDRRVGGWGHMLGDEGSAYSIASNTIREAFNQADGLVPGRDSLGEIVRGEGERMREREALPDADYALSCIYTHFGIKERRDILGPIYRTFDKATVAGLASLVAEGAKKRDPFCVRQMSIAGRDLGRIAATLLPHIPTPPGQEGGWPRPVKTIVAVGSVWKSYQLFRGIFDAQIPCTSEYRLVRLSVPAACGAAWYAHLLCCGTELPRGDWVQAL
ncbi:hypothetical protein KIPB_008473, partial [Kipferlia bialata]